MYTQKTVKEYIDSLAARESVPGGGSATALTGALGAALLEMVCNFTLENEKYKDIEGVIAGCLGSIKRIREEYLLLVDEDTKVYSSICAAFRAKDEKMIEGALKRGYDISLKMCSLAKSGMEIARHLSEGSNFNLISDVGCGAEILNACFKAGAFNSEINLGGIKDPAFMKKERSALDALKKDIAVLYEKAIAEADKRMV
ncbi:MAG: cyclodeaminase/cyclohydrolase family protein [Candidatus Omnitrophota bacterium]|jgi:formiminotetrahydrofolate cyclodeaminase